MNKFERLLERDGPVILDGGLATQLESMDHDIDGDLWSAKLLHTDPRAIIDAHLAYLEVGAEIIVSASYQASRHGFVAYGLDAAEADSLIVAAVRIAREARDEFLASHPDAPEPLVAASVGPYGATRHDGSEYTGIYDIADAELGAFHSERLQLLDGAGADLLAVETIPNFREAQILCDLLDDVATPAWVTFACRDERNLSDGSRLWAAAGLFADHPKVLALGVNCTPPVHIMSLIQEVAAAAPDKKIVVYPNSGETYRSKDNSWHGSACDLDSDFDVAGWHAAGAMLIGGCCRTGPADIGKIRARLLA